MLDDIIVEEFHLNLRIKDPIIFREVKVVPYSFDEPPANITTIVPRVAAIVHVVGQQSVPQE
jgi:hypothetical protein